MKRLILVLVGWSLLCGAAFGSEWPQVEKIATGWEGPRQVILRTGLEDPLGEPAMQSLLELLLDQGFIVVPEKSAGAKSVGLILDVRRTKSQTAVAVIRAADGAILAFERRDARLAAAPAPISYAQVPSPPPKAAPSDPSVFPGGLLDVPGSPKRLALTELAENGTAELLLLSDNRIDRVRLSSRGVEPIASCEPPVAARALHVDTADLDKDGKREVAVVMAEDLRDIVGRHAGTDSRIHGWFPFGITDGCDFASDFHGYLRMLDDRLFFQSRASFAPFADGVFPLRASANGYRPGEALVPWAGFDLYHASPLPGGDEALAWVEKERLAVVSRKSGRVLPGGRLLEDLGTYEGPEVAVRLKEAKYRTGFDDQVTEEYHFLPRRLTFGVDGKAYTMDRGRRMPEFALLGSPSGQDSIVRLSWDGRQLELERPFPGVDYFILDFALVERSGRSSAILLLNEKPDGSGQTWLLVQDAR